MKHRSSRHNLAVWSVHACSTRTYAVAAHGLGGYNLKSELGLEKLYATSLLLTKAV